jgi:recombination protein RecA
MAKAKKAAEGTTKEPKAKKGNSGFQHDNVILQQVITALEQKHGTGIVTTLSGKGNALQPQKRQIPSGSIGLDIAIGPMIRKKDGSWQTGFGAGRIIEVFGPEGAGKTTLTLVLIANAQQMGLTCAFIDAEHNLDVNYAAKLGVDMSKLLFIQPQHGEQALQVCEELVRSGQVHLIIVDSVAALIPKSELEGDIGDSSVGVQARMMSQSLKKFTNLLGQGSMCNIYFTNQIREKIGVMFGSPETTPGGRALKFYASFRIDVRRTKNIKVGGEDAPPVGHEMRLKLIKNKTGSPFQETPVDLYWGVGIDTIAELIDLTSSFGIIEKRGAFFYYGGKMIAQGRANAVVVLREDRRLCYELYNSLLTAVLAKRGYNPDLSPIDGFVHEGTSGMPMVEMFAPTDKESPFATTVCDSTPQTEDGEDPIEDEDAIEDDSDLKGDQG